MRIQFDDPDGSPRPHYSIEYTAEATDAILEAASWYSKSSPGFATRWSDGLQAAIDKLAIHPESHPIAATSRHFTGVVRRMLYKAGGTAFNVFYTVAEPPNQLPGTISILLIRNAVMRPLEELIDEEADESDEL